MRRLLVLSDDETAGRAIGSALAERGAFLVDFTPGEHTHDAMVVFGRDATSAIDRARKAQKSESTPVMLLTEKAAPSFEAQLQAGVDVALVWPADPVQMQRHLSLLIETNDLRIQVTQRDHKLEQLKSEYSRWMAALAHDAKNPLGIILTNAQWAMGEIGRAPAEELSGALQDVAQAAHKLERVLEEMTVLSHLEEGRLVLRGDEIGIADMVSGIVRARPPVARKTIAVRIDERLQLRADSKLIHRVIEWLLDRAIRTIVANEFLVTARRSRGSDRLELHISSAKGEVPSDLWVRVGDERASNDRGLGTYFCRRVIEAHGGVLFRCDDGDCKGAFVITLPS